MTSSPPCRRLLPEPVETSARSFRSLDQNEPETSLSERIQKQASISSDPHDSPDQMRIATAHPRSFPEPIGTSTNIPRNTDEKREHVGHAPKSPKNQSEPDSFISPEAETSTRSARKFAVEPVETSRRSNHRRKGNLEDRDRSPPTRRRFSPRPVETRTSSTSGKQADASKAQPTGEKRFAADREAPKKSEEHKADPPKERQPQPRRRKFAAEPVETSVRRRRKQTEEEAQYPSSSDDKAASMSSDDTKSPRKFSPELIETARGSFRRPENMLRVNNAQTIEQISEIPWSPQPPLAPATTPAFAHEELPQLHESRFSAANLGRKQSRQHSFMIPELPSIESNSSEDNSASPSLATSPAASSEESSNRQGEKIMRSIQDGPFRDYLLSAAAQAAEKQLRAQAMAAYPNEQEHEPVQHFAVEDSDDDSLAGKLEGDDGTDPRVFRRESGADLDWHLKEMRKHHAQLENAKIALKEDTAGQSRFSAAALSARQRTHAKKLVGGNQKGVGLAEMRSAASPPMLGDDLVFPMSVSPKMTRCDVDQIPVPRNREREDSEEQANDPKLWNAHISVQNATGVGLWMGFCQKQDCDDHSPPTPMRSGLMTPALAEVNSPGGFSDANDLADYPDQSADQQRLLLTPPSTQSDSFTESIAKRLNHQISVEQRIEEEFHCGFITQIYNYLSLGYPSLAHKFDPELSKISRIPVENLRKDDELADAKGYVGAPEGEGLDEESAKQGKCVRWTALRLYIHEWARQQPGMADSSPSEWGVRARRGSWAI